MSLMSRLLARRYKLPRADTYDLVVERDIRVTMDDGSVLLADRTFPRNSLHPLPTILIRTPYGRTGMAAQLLGVPLFAERGFNVLIQSCRGTFGSGGSFDPMRRERDDGRATIAWMKRQPWFSGAFAMHGVSYVGYVQWAVAQDAGPELKALSLGITSSNLPAFFLRNGGLELEAALHWTKMVTEQARGANGAWLVIRKLIDAIANRDPLARHWMKLPLSALDRAATGETVSWWQNWLQHSDPATDPYWRGTDFAGSATHLKVPAYFLAGWYDIFIREQLADYQALVDAGGEARLTVGPWTHWWSDDLMAALHPESIAWMKERMLGEAPQPRAPVRLYVLGANEWRETDAWPPRGTSTERWFLHDDASLSRSPPPESSGGRTYRYDPADPTPAVGGMRFAQQDAGLKNNRVLDRRKDVLFYDTTPFERDYEIAGNVVAEVWVRSDRPSIDLFVRLCDVDSRGRSFNFSDGYRRVVLDTIARDAGGIARVTVELTPTAARFCKGHRLRVMIASGAHPQFARNLGTREPFDEATLQEVATNSIFSEPAHPSAIVVPAWPSTPGR